MAFFNYSTMQMTAKIVYYGPGLCGKTTNLQYIYGHTKNNSRGEMVSLETQTDRTLFFDLLPLDVGSVAGFRTKIQLYTVPGQVFYNTTRKLVLKGVDGVVFVADSQVPMAQSNIEALANLGENLEELGLELPNVPLVLQYNKRDLDDVLTVEDLDAALNNNGWESFEASALTGNGVFETLRGISRLTLLSLRDQLEMTPGGSPTERPSAKIAVPAAPKAPTPPLPAPAKASTESPKSTDTGRRRRRAATPSAVAEPQPTLAPSEPAKPLRRDLLLRLPASDFERTQRLAVRLTLEDADGEIVRVTRDVRVELDRSSTDELLLSLNLALRSEG